MVWGEWFLVCIPFECFNKLFISLLFDLNVYFYVMAWIDFVNLVSTVLFISINLVYFLVFSFSFLLFDMEWKACPPTKRGSFEHPSDFG